MIENKNQKNWRGQLLKNISLADYTAWRVGGLAEQLYIPADLDDLSCFIADLPPNIPLLWLGLGSNVLVRDGGIDGVVIVTQGALQQFSVVDAETVRVEAGVACGQLARYTARLGLTGLEFMAGIPGTVGGALAMNAGCYGHETWQNVMQVETINRFGEKNTRSTNAYQVGYRHVVCPAEEWFTAAHFRLAAGEKTTALEKIRLLLEKRNASQPTNLPNCGSVFRNPASDYAARLIEQCGLKGSGIGGAVVSEKHANFIINTGKALSADIEALIAKITQMVEEKHGVRLVPEVCIIGKA